MGFHLLTSGETLATHARRAGLPWQKVWMDQHNAALRSRCGDDPDRVAVGDEIFVPERESKWAEVVAGQAHRFTARPATEAIRIELTGPEGLPLSGGTWELEFDGALHRGSAATRIEIEGPFASRTAQLRLFDARGRNAAEWLLHLGELPPCTADEGRLQGMQARLQNLGFDPGALDGRAGRRTRAAIRAFQQASGSTPTGRPQDIVEHLRLVHGS